MHSPGAATVLVRYGEIGLKGDRLQTRMEIQLQENITAILDDRGLPGSIERAHTRLYVHTDTEQIEAVTDAVTDTFGVVSASPTRRVEPTESAICEALAETTRAIYDGESFAVRVQRAGPPSAHPFSSLELERAGGDAVTAAARERGIEPTVDLDGPELTFSVECREDDAYIFLEQRTGPGGLPVGTQQPLVALVSGGIDSPVAAWLAMKRGAPVYPLYIDLGEYGGVDHRMRAIETVETISGYVPNFDCRLRVAPAGEAIDRLADVNGMYRMLVTRRFMFRVAEAVADELDAVGIVTGESIGQKSSQTTTNLRVTSQVTALPIHRPLLSMNKTAITELAKEIGSYEESTIDAGCQALASETPAVHPPLEQVRDAAPEEMDRLVADASKTTILDPSH